MVRIASAKKAIAEAGVSVLSHAIRHAALNGVSPHLPRWNQHDLLHSGENATRGPLVVMNATLWGGVGWRKRPRRSHLVRFVRGWINTDHPAHLEGRCPIR